jgi:hypothetical protein
MYKYKNLSKGLFTNLETPLGGGGSKPKHHRESQERKCAQGWRDGASDSVHAFTK